MSAVSLAEAIASGRIKPGGVRVESRAELAEYLRRFPLQLRATRPSRPPHVGHPKFVGPKLPEQLRALGVLSFDCDGAASFTVRKELWERECDEKILRFLGEL